jgi:hypothetical protein
VGPWLLSQCRHRKDYQYFFLCLVLSSCVAKLEDCSPAIVIQSSSHMVYLAEYKGVLVVVELIDRL